VRLNLIQQLPRRLLSFGMWCSLVEVCWRYKDPSCLNQQGNLMVRSTSLIFVNSLYLHGPVACKSEIEICSWFYCNWSHISCLCHLLLSKRMHRQARTSQFAEARRGVWIVLAFYPTCHLYMNYGMYSSVLSVYLSWCMNHLTNVLIILLRYLVSPFALCLQSACQ